MSCEHVPKYIENTKKRKRSDSDLSSTLSPAEKITHKSYEESISTSDQDQQKVKNSREKNISHARVPYKTSKSKFFEYTNTSVQENSDIFRQTKTPGNNSEDSHCLTNYLFKFDSNCLNSQHASSVVCMDKKEQLNSYCVSPFTKLQENKMSNSNICRNDNSTIISNWHSPHHRLFFRQQLEVERRRASLLNKPSGNEQRLSNLLMNQLTNRTVHTDVDSKVDKLKKIIFSNSKKISSTVTKEWEENTCVICFTKFIEQPLLRKLSCHHIFHMHCIDKWLFNQMSCPVCRLPVNKD